MPTYDYEILDKNGEPIGETFEVFQSMADKPLTKHPETGAPVRRAISAPHIAGKMSPIRDKAVLSDTNLEKHGFTKYKRCGEGCVEKCFGSEGPDFMSAD